MGSVFSKNLDAANELEQLVLQLDKTNLKICNIQRSRYTCLWWLTVLFVFISSVYSAIVCINDSESRIPLVILIWLFGTIIFIIARFLLSRFFDFIIRRADQSKQELDTRRSQIIEQVKEKATYKVAKEIILKYGSQEDLAEIGIAKANNSRATSKSQPKLVEPTTQSPEKELPKSTPNPDQTLSMIKQPRPQMTNFNQAFMTPRSRHPVRPFINPSRTPIDKILDLIIGDGPSSRFALICSQCHVHNGMSLEEEFQDMSFICFACGFFNPARSANPRFNQRPNPPSLPTIRTATNSESSDNEDEDTLNNEEKKDAEEDKTVDEST